MDGIRRTFGIFGLLILAGVLLAGCTSGSVKETGTSGTSQTDYDRTGSVSATASPSAGTTNVENGQVGTAYEISYISSKYQVTLEKTAFESSTYGGSYLMAFFRIKNTGDQSEYFAPDVYALDASSEKYDKTYAIGLGTEYDKTLDILKKLTPGTQTSGWVAIKVPEGAKEFDVYFEYTNAILDKTPKYIKYKIG